MDELPAQAPPAGEHRLDLDVAATLSSEPSVYAAWITQPEALAQAGIAGPVPFLVYVGKADGPRGLKERLTRHARFPWWELVDLLASRRTVLPAWWAHAPKNTQHRTLEVPALAKVSADQARAWQHEHLRWGWVTKPKPAAAMFEAAMIASNPTLLNRKGRGYGAQPPAQLRAIGSYEAARAWWLFHVSWLAVITLRPDGWIRRSLGSHVVASDDAGWPVPVNEGTTHKVKIPSERAARRLLAGVAAKSLRNEAAEPTSASQATAWWAAYCGHAFLPDAQLTEDALRGALAREDSAYRSPPTLPTGSSRDRLVSLVKLLPGVVH